MRSSLNDFKTSQLLFLEHLAHYLAECFFYRSLHEHAQSHNHSDPESGLSLNELCDE